MFLGGLDGFSAKGIRHLVGEIGASRSYTARTYPLFGRTLWMQFSIAEIQDAQKEAILGGNLVKLLRL
jgi:hypothetical protein